VAWCSWGLATLKLQLCFSDSSFAFLLSGVINTMLCISPVTVPSHVHSRADPARRGLGSICSCCISSFRSSSWHATDRQMFMG
jgi:hypothetical protein